MTNAQLALIGFYLLEGRNNEKSGQISIEWSFGDADALLADAEGWALEDEPERYAEIMTDAKHEAPAEGAGEALEAAESIHAAAAIIYEDQALLDNALVVLNHLRARSSAPEAREGEAFPEIEPLFWAWLKERDLCPDGDVVEWQDIIVALDEHEIEIMATPSADKLRIAVEALEPFANLGVSSGPDDEPCHYAYRITRGAIRNARQALAALKAEAA